jgi:hypothetical protein
MPQIPRMLRISRPPARVSRRPLNTGTMTAPSSLAAALLANFRTIRVPAPVARSGRSGSTAPDWFHVVKARRANRRAADAYRDQIRSQLAEHGHCRFLDHLEPDPDGGWRLHIFVADEPAMSPLADISDGRCGPGDPVNFDPEEFVSEHVGRMERSDSVRAGLANYTPSG